MAGEGAAGWTGGAIMELGWVGVVAMDFYREVCVLVYGCVGM
jgi:hypothetical protein